MNSEVKYAFDCRIMYYYDDDDDFVFRWGWRWWWWWLCKGSCPLVSVDYTAPPSRSIPLRLHIYSYIIFVVFFLGLGFQKPVQAYSLFNGILACAFCPKKEGSSVCLSPCSFVRLHTYVCVYKQTCVGEYIPYMVYMVYMV